MTRTFLALVLLVARAVGVQLFWSCAFPGETDVRVVLMVDVDVMGRTKCLAVTESRLLVQLVKTANIAGIGVASIECNFKPFPRAYLTAGRFVTYDVIEYSMCFHTAHTIIARVNLAGSNPPLQCRSISHDEALTCKYMRAASEVDWIETVHAASDTPKPEALPRTFSLPADFTRSTCAKGYVCVDRDIGNDATCVREGAPCKTITKALSLGQPGDRIGIGPGVYEELHMRSDVTIAPRVRPPIEYRLHWGYNDFGNRTLDDAAKAMHARRKR
jgi:hypothetical protein